MNSASLFSPLFVDLPLFVYLLETGGGTLADVETGLLCKRSQI